MSALYDRYSSDLLASLTGERLQHRLTVISGRLRAFLEARAYQVETLAGYPALASLLGATEGEPIEPSLEAVLQFEADHPDLYGILLFSADGRLVRSFPGQAAGGPPYWGGTWPPLDGFRRMAVDDYEIAGPIPPRDGQPSSFLILRDLSPRSPGDAPAGKIGLHVRLASLTELLGPDDDDGLFEPLLLTPDNIAFSNIGTPMRPAGTVVEGAEILPGWRPALAIRLDRLAAPLKRVRYILMLVILFVMAAQLGLFVRLYRHIRGRVAALVDGAREIADGNLGWRIDPVGQDEIATLASAFNRMADRLQQVVRASVEVEKKAILGEFAAGVAHEVRNPLAAMKTSVQVLKMQETDGARRDILRGLGEEIDRLEAILDEFIVFARPRSPRFEAVPIRELFRRTRAMVEKQARDSGIRISCTGELDLEVWADGSQLQQVLMNLVLNAFQAMPQGGLLTLRAERRPASAIIAVADTGEGIAPEVLPRITDPFFTTRPGGTGLGLAISRQLVENNAGRLDFTSEPRGGTTATVTLPLAREQR